MSNKVQTNNTNLQTILDTVNALPDAGSGGGGGGSVETCTVRPYLLNGLYYGYDGTYYATVYRNGKIQSISGDWNDTDITPSNPITDVVCGSVFILEVSSYTTEAHGGATLLGTLVSKQASAYSMPITAGADVQLFASKEIS